MMAAKTVGLFSLFAMAALPLSSKKWGIAPLHHLLSVLTYRPYHVRLVMVGRDSPAKRYSPNPALSLIAMLREIGQRIFMISATGNKCGARLPPAVLHASGHFSYFWSCLKMPSFPRC